MCMFKMLNDCRSHIFKKSDTEQAFNYRSLSILSHFNKIMKKLIYNRITSFIEKNNLLCEGQFGFRKHSSNICAINSIYDNFVSNVEKMYLHATCF